MAKQGPRRPKTATRRPKTATRQPQDSPGEPQEPPRSPQEVQQCPAEAPKRKGRRGEKETEERKRPKVCRKGGPNEFSDWFRLGGRRQGAQPFR
eukprot:2146798-Pyramimonas_sp.AAC.1